jgi:hypothetical protein
VCFLHLLVFCAKAHKKYTALVVCFHQQVSSLPDSFVHAVGQKTQPRRASLFIS